MIGLTFVFPLAYFAYKRRIPKRLTYSLTGLALLIGAQGALGWYMVKSGLEDEILTTPGAVPRVSQYRLAAHLGTAFLLYAGMFWHGMAIVKDWKYAHGKAWSGLVANGKDSAEKMCVSVSKVLVDPKVRGFKRLSWALTGLVLLTALSGTVSILGLLPNHINVNWRKVPSSRALMQVYFITNSLSWEVVWPPQQTNCSLCPMLRTQTSQIPGGATYSKTPPLFNSITVSL